MSWLFSQALAGEYLAATFLDGEPCVPSSGNPIQQAYCAPDKMTVFSRLSRFGMTYKPLTEDRGEALLMSYREGFLVRTSLLQEPEQGLTESDQECGKKWHGSFTKYDPDSCSWRTHQCLLLGDLELFLGTWPRWGLMRDGECWEQQTLAHHISETEFGFLPNGETFFHTPNTTGMDGGSNSRKALTKRKEMWPTPCLPDNGGTNGKAKLKAMLNWPTPRTAGMCGGTGSWELLKKNTTIEEARQMGAGNGGKLNPMWVEWLMGWPVGWTDLKPLETDKFQKWLDEHGSY
jgi:hypothetical protein